MATTYTAIPDGSVDAESPGTTGLVTLLRDNPIAIAEQSADAPFTTFSRFINIREAKAQGTNSATSLADEAWTARRDLAITDDHLNITGGSLGSIGGANDTEITLPVGRYWMDAEAIIEVAENLGAPVVSRLRWVNVTDGAAIEFYGMSYGNLEGNSAAGDGAVPYTLRIRGQFGGYDAAKTFRLDHWKGGAGAAMSGGTATNLAPETYTQILIWRLDTHGT